MPATMLVLDFVVISLRSRVMDDDTRELISLLTTRVGMLMEDRSVYVLTCGRQSAADIADMLDELETSIARMVVLIGAAKTLLE